jgi:hypothetical protein
MVRFSLFQAENALYQGTTSVVPQGPKTELGFSPYGLFLAK